MPHRPNNLQKTSQNQKQSTIRIIGGQWRGRKLPVNNADGLRPTGDRMRETLFNWLMPYIHGAHIWDLFAGTGALGLEALSRGAHSATFFELNHTNANLLRDNLALLTATESNNSTNTNSLHRCKAKTLNLDTLKWLQQKSPCDHQGPIDLVFIDPPFAHNLWQDTITALDTHPQLAANLLIYVESARDTAFVTPPSWRQLKHKQSGAISARLYERNR